MPPAPSIPRVIEAVLAICFNFDASPVSSPSCKRRCATAAVVTKRSSVEIYRGLSRAQHLMHTCVWIIWPLARSRVRRPGCLTLDKHPNAFRHGRTTPARPARPWSVLTVHGLAERKNHPRASRRLLRFQAPRAAAVHQERHRWQQERCTSDSWSSSGGNCTSSGNSGIGSSGASGASGGGGASGAGSGRATKGSFSFQPQSLRIVLSKWRIHRLSSASAVSNI